MLPFLLPTNQHTKRKEKQIMVSKHESTRLNKELKGLMGEYKRSYEQLQRQSEAKYKTTLQPGQTFHAQQGFYDAESRAQFSSICNDLKEKAHALIDKAALEVMAENTKAPSAEAVNVVTLLNARQKVSPEEIDQLMTKYGVDCPMVYKALHEKAESLGYHDFKPHPIVEAAENMEMLNSTIDRCFNANNAEHSMVTTTAAFGVTVDSAFPAEE